MASKSPLKSFPVRGRASGALEGLASKLWRQLERFAQALRSLADKPMTQAGAERLAKRFGVHWATVYRYRARLREVDEATAITGRTRGWKPAASRLTSNLPVSRRTDTFASHPAAGPASPCSLTCRAGAQSRIDTFTLTFGTLFLRSTTIARRKELRQFPLSICQTTWSRAATNAAAGPSARHQPARPAGFLPPACHSRSRPPCQSPPPWSPAPPDPD